MAEMTPAELEALGIVLPPTEDELHGIRQRLTAKLLHRLAEDRQICTGLGKLDDIAQRSGVTTRLERSHAADSSEVDEETFDLSGIKISRDL
jgi:phosphopentomutase